MSDERTTGLRRSRRLLLGALCLATMAGTIVAPVGVPSAHAALGAGGEYHPVTPARIVDTRRAAVTPPDSSLKFGQTYSFALTGSNSLDGTPSGIPAQNVLAVMATVTITGATRAGYATLFPSGTAIPDASNVNFEAGRDMSNVSLLRPGADGSVSISFGALDGKNSGASAQVIVDVLGWFSTSAEATRGARLVSVEPGRVLDSRSGYARSGAVGPGESFEFTVRGAPAYFPDRAAYIPDDPNITTVLLNVTAVAGKSPTFISVQPDPFSGFPTTSNLNLRANEVKANLVLATVAADGKIRIFNERGSTHVIADVVGYFRAGVNDETRTGRIVPLSSPFRIFDTRVGEFAGRLGQDSWETWDLDDDAPGKSFVKSVLLEGTWVGNISSVLMNLTVPGMTCPCQPSTKTDTFLYLFPDPNDPNFDPDDRSSNINTTVTNGAIANFVVARLSAEDKLGVYNKTGFVHYLGDVAAVVLE